MFPFKSVNSDRMLATLTNIIHDNNYPTYKLSKPTCFVVN